MCCRLWAIIVWIILPTWVSAQENVRFTTESFPKDTAQISQLLKQAKALRHKPNDSGILLYFHCLKLSKDANYVDGLARSYTGLGLYHMDKGDYNKSLLFYTLAKPYCEKATFGGGILIANLYNNIAALYGNRGITDSAIHFYYKSLKEIEKRHIKDTTLLVLVHSNLGGRLASEKLNKQALFYLQKGMKMAEKAGNKNMLAKFYVDMSLVYGNLKKYKECRSFANNALSLFIDIKDPASHISAYCNIAKSYYDQRDFKTAISYYQRSFSDSIRGSQTQLAPAYRGLGACYYGLKDYKRAEDAYLEALRISKDAKVNSSMMDCYRELEKIYTAQADYKMALESKNSYLKIEDSTTSSERMNYVNQLEVKYRTSEKDKDLAQQQLQLAHKVIEIRRKNAWILGVSGFAVLLGVLFVSLYRSRRHKEKLRIITLEKQREVAQLKSMMEGEEKERERIARELHDGIMVQFSSVGMNLGALMEKSGLSHSADFEDILSQLDDATKELRKSAHNLMPDILLQEGLAEATHYFCKNLERSAQFSIDFQLIGEMPTIAAEYELMIYRIIQELLQNVVKYAKASYALVQINCQSDLISIVVEDDGIGLNTVHKKEKGTGIKNIERRVQSLHGHFNISSEPNSGTSIYIELETKYLQSPGFAISDAHSSSNSR